MDFVRSYLSTNEPLTSWTLFLSLFGWFAVYTQHTQQTDQKVFYLSEVHLYQRNFLQNPYFRSWRLKTNWKQKRADNKKEQRWMGLDSIIDGKAVTIMTFFFFFFFSHCCQYPRGFGQTNENRVINNDKEESYWFVNLIFGLILTRL